MNDKKYLDTVMPLFNLIEYNNIYSKTSVRCEKYCTDKQKNPIRNSK